jgi:hypothetical protein
LPRAKLVDEIDKKTLEIREADGEVYSDMGELADELPEHAPRFVLLSYPLTLVCSPIPSFLRPLS